MWRHLVKWAVLLVSLLWVTQASALPAPSDRPADNELLTPKLLAGEPQVLATAGSGRLEMHNNWRVLHLRGSAYEMGVQHGALLRAELARIKHLLDPDEGKRRSWPTQVLAAIGDLYQRTFGMARLRRIMPQAYLEELRGIVAGADGAVDLDTLVAWQYLFASWEPKGSAFAVERSSEGKPTVVQASNLDLPLPAEWQELLTVMVIHPDEGEPFVSIGLPGLVGAIEGMNAAGLVASYKAVTADDQPEGTPAPILVRQALQYATDTDQAYATFSGWPRYGGSAVIVTDARPAAVCIEFNSSRIAVRSPQRGVLTTTGFFLTPALVPFTRPQAENLRARHEWLAGVLQAERAALTPLRAAAVLGMRADDYTGANVDTVMRVVYDPGARRLWVAKVAPDAAADPDGYTAISLGAEF